MKEWLKISLMLCTFGFFREMRPSEPFVTEFLSGEWRNITSEQVNREIYPFGTYSYTIQLLFIFLITDVLRYKPIIVLSACVGIALWSMLLWTTSFQAILGVQVLYGTFMAAEVAYYTYMYAKVEKSKYQKVTGHARAAILSGRFLASVLAQLIVSFELMDLRELNYISLGAQATSLLFAVFLPSVGISLYFYSVPTAKSDPSISGYNMADTASALNQGSISTREDSIKSLTDDFKPKFSCSRAVSLLWLHFREAYSNTTILTYSIWWSLAMAGFLQVQSYVQLLWQAIDGDRENFYNGAVEAALTLFGAMSALLAGFMTTKKFQEYDIWILAICSLLEGIFIIISAVTDSVWVAYSMYVLFGVLYFFMITVASATVAKNLADDSFALIFGFNTWIAVIIQSILTIVSVSNTAGLGLEPREQFVVFGGYFIGLAIIYFIASIVKCFFGRRSQHVEINE